MQPSVKMDRWVAFCCLIVSGALLGLSTNLAKVAQGQGLPALPFLTWSVAGAAVLLGAFLLMQQRALRLDMRTSEYFLVAALVSFAAPNLILFSAVPHVGAGFAALAIAFPPLLTYLGALALRIEDFALVRAAGVILALIGATVLAYYKFQSPDAAALWIAATLAAPVFLAMGNLYRSLRWPPGASAEELAPGMLVGAFLLLLAYALLTQQPLAVDPATLPLIALQASAFALQYWTFFILQKRGGPVFLSLLGSVAALVAVPFAVFLLDEAWPKGLAVSSAFILSGIALLLRQPRPR